MPMTGRTDILLTLLPCLRAVMAEIIAENEGASRGRKEIETELGRRRIWSQERRRSQDTLFLSLCSFILSPVLCSRLLYHQGCVRQSYY